MKLRSLSEFNDRVFSSLCFGSLFTVSVIVTAVWWWRGGWRGLAIGLGLYAVAFLTSMLGGWLLRNHG